MEKKYIVMPIDKEKIAALVNRINSMPDKGEEFKRRYLVEKEPEVVERNKIMSTPIKVPAVWGNASSAAVSSKDIPRVDSTVGNELRYAAAVTAPLWAGYAPGLIRALANPVGAATKAGAMASTALDAYGVAGGLSGLGYDAKKAMSGEFDAYDIPRTLLDAAVLIPGASQLTAAKNVGLLDDAIRNIANIRNITSKETLLNRLAHPLETYRFADLTRRSASVLPEDIQRQLMEDMKEATFHNGLPGTQPYNGFNRKFFTDKIGFSGGWNQNMKRYDRDMFGALADPNATNEFSRAHELGHAVDVAAEKVGYAKGSYPPLEYTYGGINVMGPRGPEPIIKEHFADIFGNSITGDMMLDLNDEIRNVRYPIVKNEFPVFKPKKK